MGSSSSRAAARGAEAAARSAAAAKQRQDAAQAALDKLPADSAVRKDARSAAQFNEWRVAQEQRLDGVTLEDENARNSALDTRMHSAMQRKEGDIEYEEHYLPLHDARLAAQLSAQVRPARLPALSWCVLQRMSMGHSTAMPSYPDLQCLLFWRA